MSCEECMFLDDCQWQETRYNDDCEDFEQWEGAEE